MENLRRIFKKGGYLHHVYLVEGERASTQKAVLDFVERDLRMKVAGNPDIHLIAHDTLGIDEARRIKELQSQTAVGEGRKIFLITFESATREAQNSLLKVFEEPTAGAHFFVISPRAHSLLPTLRSRAQLLRGVAAEEDVSSAKKFLASSLPERLSLVQTLVEEKDKEKALLFLNSLEKVLQGVFRKKLSPSFSLGFEDIERGRGYLHDRAPSVKMILEHLALTLPLF